MSASSLSSLSLALACSSDKDGQSEVGGDSAGSGADGASAINGVFAVNTNGAQLSSATNGAASTMAGTTGSSEFEECVGTVSEGEVLALEGGSFAYFDVYLKMKDKTVKPFLKPSNAARWLANSVEFLALELPDPANVASVQLKLTLAHPDGWDVSELTVNNIEDSLKASPRLKRVGDPYWRFTNSVAIANIPLAETLVLNKKDETKTKEDYFTKYVTWDGSSWCVSIEGNAFRHAPDCDWTRAHTDTIMNYLTWDGSKWSAKITGKVFTHARDGVFTTSMSHTDTILNYVTDAEKTQKWTLRLE